MALIVCPECGKNFSDKAPACPECGCPTSEIIGQSNSNDNGQLLIANNAFQDSRYDEAYLLFSQLYAQNQSSPQILVRLGLTTAAKDYFNNGIPNSTKDLIKQAFEIVKNNSPTLDELTLCITSLVKDIKKVINDTKLAVIEGLSSAINQTAPMRGAGSMIADALFSPVASANRNLYEDRRTAENNAKILNNAISNKKAITATLDSFGSFVLNLVADILTEPLDSSSELLTDLGDFVVSSEDSKVYDKLSAGETPQGNVYGLCYGEEVTLLDFNNNCSFLHINGKPHASGFAPPKGHIVLTNYKVVYNALKDKFSFEKSLDDLVRVEVGGPGSWQTHIVLIFPNNVKVLISPEPAGMQAMYVATINEELKMRNR